MTTTIPALDKAFAEADAMVDTALAAARSQAKAASLPLPVGSMSAGGFGLPTSANYSASALYSHNRGWVYASVKAIAQRGAGQPIRVARILPNTVTRSKQVDRATLPRNLKHVAGQLEILDSHPILDALADPNEEMVSWSLVYMTLASLELTGKGFWWLYDRGDGQLGIWPIPCHWIEPKHEGRFFSRYIIRPPSMPEGFEVDGQFVVRFAYPDPANPLGALSPLEAQGRAVSADESIQESQARAFHNGIYPGHLIRVGKAMGADGKERTPMLERAQRDELLTAIKQRYQGVRRFDEPLILDALIESVERLTNTPDEMDFLDSGKSTKGRITQGFGVNPLILGEIEGANRASSVVAQEHFCDVTMNPKLELVSQTLTGWLAPLYDDSGALVVYIEPCRANDPDSKRKDAALLLKAESITRNELRAMAGLPALSGPEGDELAGASKRENQTDDATEAAKSGVTLPAIHKAPSSRADGLLVELARESSEHEARLERAVRGFYGDALGGIVAGLADFVSESDASLPPQSDASFIVDSLFRADDFATDLIAVVRPRIEDTLLAGAENERQHVARRLREKRVLASLKMPPGDIEDFLLLDQEMPASIMQTIRAELATIMEADYWQSIAATTRDALARAIGDGIQSGDNLNGLQRRIREAIDGISRRQALTIARTEGGAALNAGHDASRQALGEAGLVTGKRWISILDNKTRQELFADHFVMHGRKTAYNGLFQVAPTNDETPYPRHFGLPAKQRVNCRCRTISVIPEFEGDDDAEFAAQLEAFGGDEELLAALS